jgi:hypothetical protein
MSPFERVSLVEIAKIITFDCWQKRRAFPITDFKRNKLKKNTYEFISELYRA